MGFMVRTCSCAFHPILHPIPTKCNPKSKSTLSCKSFNIENHYAN